MQKILFKWTKKKTWLLKPENADTFHDFTFDHSYWSFDTHNDVQHIVSQEEVYNDLGVDVINCAFQGTNHVFFYGWKN